MPSTEVNTDINDPGKPGTLQRVVYDIPRARSPEDWRVINNALQDLLGEMDPLDPAVLVVNALATCTEKLRSVHHATVELRRILDIEVQR